MPNPNPRIRPVKFNHKIGDIRFYREQMADKRSGLYREQIWTYGTYGLYWYNTGRTYKWNSTEKFLYVRI